MMYCICFFKQKTVYELRISDWSSDVCSSDLTEQSILKMMGSEAIQRAREEAVERLGPSSLDHTARPPLRHLQLDSYSESRFDRYLRSFAGTIAGDRKSVVQGTSVSVRVDLGGRWNIKKTKQTKNDKTT